MIAKIVTLVLSFVAIQSQASPKIFFSYAQSFDNYCSSDFTYKKSVTKNTTPKVKTEWKKELINRLSEFQKNWDESSPQLFNALTEITKKDFSRKEYSVELSSCEQIPSMPLPLLLNVSRFLKSYSEPKEAKNMDLFVDLPFHELLHIWLFENLKKDTPLLLKYKKEQHSVLSHIHLFALQSLIYDKVEMNGKWKQIRGFHIEKGNPHKRAIEIMEKEGSDKVLQDLIHNLKSE